jgi:hypothetical protein
MLGFTGYNNLYSIKNGFYKATSFNNRYCYIRNDTIWFNYGMPIGEGYIRFSKGVVKENGFIQLLPIKDKLQTVCDTVFIRPIKNINQLILNVYDFRTHKEIVNSIRYFLHEDYSNDYDKRIFLEKSFNFVDSNYILDYSDLKVPKAVLSFDQFKNDNEIFGNTKRVYLEIRKNEQAKYQITLAPKVDYSEHFPEIGYTYEENQDKLTLFFTKKIDGFPDCAVEYLPIEPPDKGDILQFVFLYHIK